MTSLSLKVMLAAAGVAVFLVAISLGQEMNRRRQIQLEVESLESEVAELEKTIIAKENLNQYFRTDAFQERMAREKLNFRAEGEQVILIPNDFSASELIEDQDADEVRGSNAQMWWNVFFASS